MKKVIQLPAIASEGRFGNKLIHYIVGKCYAESVGATVKIPRGWIAETIFEIDEPHIEAKSRVSPGWFLDKCDWAFVGLPPFFEMPHRLVDSCLTRNTVKRILKWRQGLVRVETRHAAAIHIRRGDFVGHPDFPIVSEEAMLEAALLNGFEKLNCLIVREDQPMKTGLFQEQIDFLEDFQTLMLAENVFVYPRSTFSQMAALLGDGNIFMPYDYGSGPTTCKFRLADPSKPVIFPTKNNNLP